MDATEKERATEREREWARREISSPTRARALLCVHPEVSNVTHDIVTSWILAEGIKWFIVGVVQIVVLTFVVTYLFTIGLVALTGLPFLLIAFTPFLLSVYLERRKKLIYVPPCYGPGGAWWSRLNRYSDLFKEMYETSHAPESTSKSKDVYTQRASVTWETLLAVSNMYRELIKGTSDITGATKDIIGDQFREFNARLRDLELIVSAMKSIEVLKISKDLEVLQADRAPADEVIGNLRAYISGVKELTASND